MISVYLKEHNTTGLKYLGITRKDPVNYDGSGSLWREHLKENGNCDY